MFVYWRSIQWRCQRISGSGQRWFRSRRLTQTQAVTPHYVTSCLRRRRHQDGSQSISTAELSASGDHSTVNTSHRCAFTSVSLPIHPTINIHELGVSHSCRSISIISRTRRSIQRAGWVSPAGWGRSGVLEYWRRLASERARSRWG